MSKYQSVNVSAELSIMLAGIFLMIIITIMSVGIGGAGSKVPHLQATQQDSATFAAAESNP